MAGGISMDEARLLLSLQREGGDNQLNRLPIAPLAAPKPILPSGGQSQSRDLTFYIESHLV
jgi:hypothetical protein